MKIIISIFFLLIIKMSGLAQTNPQKIASRFFIDLKENQINNLDLVKRDFSFRESLTPKEKEEVIFPFLIDHLNLFRQKLVEDCSSLAIIKHDDELDIIIVYKLRYSNLDNVYYAICDNSIVTAILVHDNKILSISTYSKSINGTKSFIIF